VDRGYGGLEGFALDSGGACRAARGLDCGSLDGSIACGSILSAAARSRALAGSLTAVEHRIEGIKGRMLDREPLAKRVRSICAWVEGMARTLERGPL
jgi:hypothetical protein